MHTVRHQLETVSAISMKRVSAIAEMRNLALLDRVEDYLLYDPFESTDKDEFTSAWSDVHSRIRMSVIAQKLYGGAKPSAGESPAEA